MSDPLYAVAREVTDEVLGKGTYAEINKGNPDPQVQEQVRESRGVARLDPPGCGCTDCLTGYSKPIDVADDQLKLACINGEIDNASGAKLRVTKVEWYY